MLCENVKTRRICHSRPGWESLKIMRFWIPVFAGRTFVEAFSHNIFTAGHMFRSTNQSRKGRMKKSRRFTGNFNSQINCPPREAGKNNSISLSNFQFQFSSFNFPISSINILFHCRFGCIFYSGKKLELRCQFPIRNCPCYFGEQNPLFNIGTFLATKAFVK